jgi:hypothetical protein
MRVPRVSTIEERVARGAAWLDEQEPGWARQVDLARLALSSPCRCVLGQLYGEYMDAPLVDVFGNVAGVEHGFNAGGIDTEAEFVALEARWRRVITERRAAA